ncbi:hypothetical protein O980_04470 [Mycobacterium avium subsp. paratuberculosis 08-8281]|nr:hypothetical protein O980_04470 [Mycobacterium avium subsp. paratuberculosis 08-8281]
MPGGGCRRAERGEGQHRPLVVVGGHQPPAAPGDQLEIGRRAVDLAPGFGVFGQRVVDRCAPDPVGRLHRPDPAHQAPSPGQGGSATRDR